MPLHLTPWRCAIFAGAVVLSAGLAVVPSKGQDAEQNVPKKVDSFDENGIAFVGSNLCADCHQAEHAVWLDSDHRHAMEHASAQSVLGDFSDITFEKDGETIVFHRDGERYLVRAPGADGVAQDFEILFTFGWEPLQQYLIAQPGGRLQAFDVAWDTKAGRWIDLYPDDVIPPGDPLHWTGLLQNWNFTCADCHSTALRRNYDPASDSFATTWAEVTLGCESCHGAGAAHVAWAEGKALPDGMEPGGLGLSVEFPAPEGGWTFGEGDAIAHWEGPLRENQELAVCGPCHARRRPITDMAAPDAPLLDAYMLSLLDAGLYRPDGRQEAEVYIIGSFLQSKMAAAGVICTDCHEPHSAQLKAEGNALCTQCHQAEVFDTVDHHHHPPGTEAAECVSCHMPADVYMVVDPRRDHGFHVPSEALAGVIDVVDGCADCHEPGAWTDAAAAGWWSGPSMSDFDRAVAVALGRTEDVGAAAALAELATDSAQPAIFRATAYSLLGDNLQPSKIADLVAGLSDADPLVRLGAVRGVAVLPLQQRYQVLAPLIDDPVKAVRLEVASALSPVPLRQLPAAEAARLSALFEEMLAVERLFLDRPESHFNIANHFADQGDSLRAERSYRAALARDPTFVPAYVNLAELQRSAGGESLGMAVLRQGLAEVPDAPALHYALGLALYRQGDKVGGLVELAEAARLGQGEGSYDYAYALALEDGGDRDKAIAVLEASLESSPNNRQVLYALIYLLSTSGDTQSALLYARHLAALEPEDESIADLLRRLGG